MVQLPINSLTLQIYQTMRVVIYELLNTLSQKLVAPAIRTTGKRLYQLGNKLEGDTLSEDRVTPSLRQLTYQGKQPQLQNTSFVAPNAVILGDVIVGTNSSVWYGSTIIGTTPIRIGNNTIIQDRVHISRTSTIGDNVFVGPNVILQGSTLHNRSFVSMGATVRHSIVHSGGFVAAGAVIPDNIQIKEGEIWAGNPGKFLRNITLLEREVLKEHLQEIHQLAAIHNEETEKTTREVINGSNYREEYGANIEEYLQDPGNYQLAYTEDDAQFLEQRIVMKDKLEYPEMGQDYEPYRFEDKNIPNKFKVGLHEEQFVEVALKLKSKETFSDTKPWSSPY